MPELRKSLSILVECGEYKAISKQTLKTTLKHFHKKIVHMFVSRMPVFLTPVSVYKTMCSTSYWYL